MNTVEIIFSPTGGTEKAAHMISGQWSESTVKIDLSDPSAAYSQYVINKDDAPALYFINFSKKSNFI